MLFRRHTPPDPLPCKVNLLSRSYLAVVQVQDGAPRGWAMELEGGHTVVGEDPESTAMCIQDRRISAHEGGEGEKRGLNKGDRVAERKSGPAHA